MIAACWDNADTTGFYFTYYPVAATSYYFEEPEVDSYKELRRKWWLYLESILAFQQSANPVISYSAEGPRFFMRIHHEKQYPRIIKGRNNRNP